MSLYLKWWQGDVAVTSKLLFPISYPGDITDAIEVRLTTSAADSLDNLETLHDLKLYLDGDATDLQEVMELWPYAGGLDADGNHLYPELDGGVELSFDDAITWQRLQYRSDNLDGRNLGSLKDPSTWIMIPSEAMGSTGIAGVLNPFESCRFLIRLRIPPSASATGQLDLNLGFSCDIR